MRLPTLRVLSASGAYLRGRLKALCNSLGLRRVRYGSRTEILDGYILRANAVNGRIQGLLLDPPGVLAMGLIVRDGSQLVRRPVSNLSLATHRDGLSPDLRVLPETPGDGLPTSYADMFISGDLTGTIGRPSVVTGYNNTHYRRAGATVLATWVGSVPYITADTMTPENRAPREFFVRTDMAYPLTEAQPWAGPTEPGPRGITVYVGESFFLNALLWTKVTADSGWSQDVDTLVRNEFINQPPPVATGLPLPYDAETDTTRYLVAVSAATQVSEHDSHGSRLLVVLRVDVVGSGDNIDFFVEPVLASALADNPNPLMVPYLDNAVPSSDLLERYRYNTFFPTYMVLRDDGMAVLFLRAATDQPLDPNDTDPINPDSIRYYQLTVAVLDPLTGAVADAYTPIDPEPSASAVPTVEAPPLISAIGAATDGEQVVYLAWGEAVVVAPATAYTVAFSTAGFGRFPDGGIGTGVSGLPGWEQTAGPFVPTTPWQKGESTKDALTYIGNHKYVFPVSLTAENEGDTYDLTLAAFDVSTGSVTVLGTVLDNIPSHSAMEGPEDRARSLAPIQCIQREIADDEGEVIMPAVLLVSVGDSNLSGDMFREGRGTWISHDSGSTFTKIHENGSGNFAYYVGSATYRPPPGEMFMKEPE